jgi:GT2 family glycosyltransferase
MDPRVTAVVVARNGGDHLRRTLQALKEQTRPPDAIVAIDCASTDDTAAILSEFGPTHLIAVPEKLPFGSAVATAARVVPPTQSDEDWLWLLSQDTAPEPDALRLLLGTVEVSPSVGVAGPKQVDWDDRTFIRELGEAMTPLGASIPYVEDELDQAQHDDLSDVLGVGPGGMLVRQTLWERLGGFDPGLPSVDDGLDFCIRARLAGFRVTLVPAARLATAGDGIAGPSRSKRATARIRLGRDRRRAQLHRRMAYSASGLVAIHWLSLVPLAFVRAVGRLIGKQPGLIGSEFSAAFRVAFSGVRVGAARRAIARNNVAGWASIAPLRIPLSEARRVRALKRELSTEVTRGEHRSLDFLSAGGALVVLVMLVVSVGLFFPLLNAQSLSGGGLLPLSGTLSGLWHNASYGWRDIGLGFTGAADPFSAVIAVLGSVTFWQPSLSIVILYFAALPVSAMGAWLLGARLTDRSLPRAFAAIAWALSPTLLAAMQTGRPAAIIAHILLPWLFFAGLAASRSWASTATTALLAAAVVACAPSLAPALAVIWIVSLVIARGRAGRLVYLPVPTLALFAPLIWQQGARGNWISLFADPGVPTSSAATHSWSFVMGSPASAATGWNSLLAGLGLPGGATGLIVPILLVPIAVLAVLSLFLRGSARATAALAVALLGFATAVGAAGLSVAVSGSQTVSIWPGAGLSLYWLGVVVAGTIALSTLGRFASAPTWIASLALAAAMVPVAIGVPLGTSAVQSGSGQTLPAVVTADASTHPRVGTLIISPQSDGAIAAQVVRGTGATLDAQSTLDSTARNLSPGDRDLAVLAGNLVSQSGMNESTELDRLGIGFVMLAQGDGASATSAAQQTSRRGQSALDGNALLTSIGPTPTGALWSYRSGRAPTPPAAEIPPNAGQPLYAVVSIGQIVVLAVTLLLAVPIGGARMRLDPIVPSLEPVKRRRRRQKPVGSPGLPDDDFDEYDVPEPEPEPELEPESDPAPESGQDRETAQPIDADSYLDEGLTDSEEGQAEQPQAGATGEVDEATRPRELARPAGGHDGD